MKNYTKVIEEAYLKGGSISGFLNNSEFLLLKEELEKNATKDNSTDEEVKNYCSFVFQCFYEMKDLGNEIFLSGDEKSYLSDIISTAYRVSKKNKDTIPLVELSHFFFLNFFIFNSVSDYIKFVNNEKIQNRKNLFEDSLFKMFSCVNLLYSSSDSFLVKGYPTIDYYLISEIYTLEKMKFFKNISEVLTYFGFSLSEFLYIESETDLAEYIQRISSSVFDLSSKNKKITPSFAWSKNN